MTAEVLPLDDAAYYGLPEAKAEDPFSQVIWVFEQRLSRVPSKSGQENYRYALSVYLRFLMETEGTTPVVLKEHWDSLALIRFRTWLLTQEQKDGSQFTSHTLGGIVSAVRQAMTEAVALGLTSTTNFINIPMPMARRETDKHDPYDAEEVAGILEAVKHDLEYTNAILAGYQRTSLSGILCVRHNMSPRSMYANQDEQEEAGSGAAQYSERTD